MNKMYRLLALVLLAAFVLSGCGQPIAPAATDQPVTPPATQEQAAQPGGNPVKISLGYPADVHAVALLENLDRCAEQVGVEVELFESSGSEWRTTLPAEAATQSGLFDLVYHSAAQIPALVAADYLIPLEDFDIEAIDPADIPLFNNAEYEGKHYIIPWMNEIQGILYRSDLVNDPEEQAAFEAKYGYPLTPPSSLDQYFDQLEFFHRPDDDLFGAVLYGQRAIWITIAYDLLMNRQGMEFIDHETLEVQVNTPEGVEALRQLKRMYEYADPASYTAGWTEGNANFQQGRDYSLITWTTMLLYSNDPANSQIVGNIGFMPAPLPDDNVASTQGFLSQWGLAVTKTSENPDKAWELAVCLTTTESHVNAVLNSDLGNIPARFSALRDEQALSRFPWLLELADALETLNIIVRPLIPEFDAIWRDTIPLYVSQVVSGELSPEEGAAEMETELLRILREGGHID